jgi:hypothetical protein
MIQLRRNGVVIEVGGAELLYTFEDRIFRWHTETSGWDAYGNYWRVTELPDVIEYESSRDTPPS